MESLKKNKRDSILHFFNRSSIVNFPTRIGPNSFVTIDDVFIASSYLNKFDVIPLINSLYAQNAQLLTIQFVQKQQGLM